MTLKQLQSCCSKNHVRASDEEFTQTCWSLCGAPVPPCTHETPNHQLLVPRAPDFSFSVISWLHLDVATKSYPRHTWLGQEVQSFGSQILYRIKRIDQLIDLLAGFPLSVPKRGNVYRESTLRHASEARYNWQRYGAPSHTRQPVIVWLRGQ